MGIFFLSFCACFGLRVFPIVPKPDQIMTLRDHERYKFAPQEIDQLRFPTRAAWLRGRERDVTASSIGALFGAHEFTTLFELWAEKSGKLPPENSENPAIERGELLEPVAVELMRRKRPDWDIQHNTGGGQIYFRDPVNRLGATPDTLVYCPDNGPGTVQVKSVERTTYRRKWLGDNDDPEPPLWIAFQACLEAHLTGSKWAAVAPLVVGYGIELPIIPIPLNPGVIDAMKAASSRFWAQVESGEEPDLDYARDRPVIERMHPVDDGGEVDLVSDRRAYALIEERSTVTDRLRALEARKDEIDAELKAKMRGAALAYLPNGMRMTWRTQRKTRPDGTVSAFRVLRVPRPAEIVLEQPETPLPDVTPPGPRKNEPWNF